MKTKMIFTLIVLLALVGCNLPQVEKLTGTPVPASPILPGPQPANTLAGLPTGAPSTPLPLPPTLAQAGPTAVPPVILPTLTPVPASSTPLPTLTPAGMPAPVTPVATVSGKQYVQIFLVALDDNGRSGPPIGCGDSLIAVQVEIAPTLGVLRAAMQTLLSQKDRFYGQSGLYNALYQSNLRVESVAIVQGEAQVHLTGTLTLGGECDNPRVESQLVETAGQFSTVKTVSIYINGKPLKDVLSLR